MATQQQLSDALNEWWNKQTKWKGYKSLSRECKIPVSSLKKYFYGVRWPQPENLEKLLSVTGLAILESATKEKTLSIKKSHPPLKKKFYKSILDKRRLQYSFRTLERLNQEIARVLGSLPPALDAIAKLDDGIKQNWAISTNIVQFIMDALERSLRPFLKSNEGLQILRKHLCGADAGYLSGLLSSLFDDQRLSTWKEMTTYTYGSKTYGN